MSGILGHAVRHPVVSKLRGENLRHLEKAVESGFPEERVREGAPHVQSTRVPPLPSAVDRGFPGLVRIQKGRERMPVEELLALQKKGKIRASHMGAILRACGCGPIPSYGTRRDLARVLRTRFPDPSDAVAELIRAQVISI